MLQIEVFTDPGCPFAWSAEPQRLRIAWLYGDQVAWTHRLVGLSERPEDYLDKGLTPEAQSEGLARIHQDLGMPIDASLRPRMLGTVVPCRAVVAARRHAPGHADALLRALRLRHFVRAELIDEPEVVAAAAADAGLDPGDLLGWMAEEGTETALRADMAAARAPLPAALGLDHKLAGPEERRRYTCPTWVLQRESRPPLVAPGFQPVEVYEVLVANAAPELTRGPEPDGAVEVLRWAGVPLAGAEVAGVLGVPRRDAELELGRVADRAPDGLWALAPRFARDAAATTPA
jgi:predicted DsbA family dithiol-disulfide isomerase